MIGEREQEMLLPRTIVTHLAPLPGELAAQGSFAKGKAGLAEGQTAGADGEVVAHNIL